MPGYSQYGFGPAGGPNGQRIYVPIPSTVVGLIIGRGGETIRYFQEQSGARVKVDLTGDPNAEERNVCISGEPQALAVAKRLVEEKVAEANPEYAAKYSSPSYTSFYEQQFQQYNYAQYYAQYGYDQYQAYAQYNYTGYQSTAGAAEAAPTTGTENAIDPNNIAETAATYYAHYYGHPQTQDQKDAYNQWFQQYYGQYYNQPSQQKEEGGSTSSLENNSKEIKEEKNQSDETKEEKDGDDSKKRKKNE
ncbi:hypothetical protein G6F55_012780 [Rhizopus delemar]|nr:hypothetical protein G6F55_012780 [Rhizopus delemar]